MRTTRHLTGSAKRRYLKGLIAAALEGSRGSGPQRPSRESQASRLLEVLDDAIVRLWARPRPEGHPGPQASSQTAPGAAAPQPPAPAPVERPQETVAPAAPELDPYSFSALAILTREGRPALEARLAQVTTRAALRALAEAQSVRLPPELLAGEGAPLETLKQAFVDGVERRLAHRRAVSG